ncbi:MAG: hypothetical protein Q4C00_03100 [Bacillota bacterium]|nr:hypothetical protein [Bacillota bacterium]
MKSYKKVVIALALVLVCLCLFGFWHLYPFCKEETKALWPENGEVIATIDGKEYRYDPVYLYRLTGCVYPQDYVKNSTDIRDYGVKNTSTFGVLYDSRYTAAESAVLLELYYLDKIPYLDLEDTYATPKEIILSRWEQLKYRNVPGTPHTEYKERYDESKFHKCQCAYCYLLMDIPYAKKMSIISIPNYNVSMESVGEYLGLTPEEAKMVGGDVFTKAEIAILMAKYNVEMVK